MTQPQQERREGERLPVTCHVTYREIRDGKPNPKQKAADTLNLSASGVCLVAAEPVEPDTHLAIEMGLEGESQPVMAIGRVVWCDSEAGRYRIGICFTWLREEDREALGVIADYVESRIGP